MNKSQLNLQDTFLNQVRKENVGVMIYLIGGVQLRGNVRGFDSFTILLDSPGKPTQLVYKHAVTSIVPMRPIQNLYSEAMREAGLAPQTEPNPTAPPTVSAGSAHPDAAVTVQTPVPAPAPAAPEAAQAELIS
jgi:host factor-I protein